MRRNTISEKTGPVTFILFLVGINLILISEAWAQCPNPPDSTVVQVSICDGDSAFLEGAYQTLAGTYYDTLITAELCDSILITELEVLPHSQIVLNANICPGDSVFAGGVYQTTSGIYSDTFAAANGCDSIVVTDLSVSVYFLSNLTVSICEGDSFFIQGTYYSESDTFYDTLSAANGCDSVVITQLMVVLSSLTNVHVSICPGDSVLAGGSFQSTPGIYYDTLTDAEGCDSVIATNLVLEPITNITVSVCTGDSFFVGGAFQTIGGTYYDTLPGSSGCDSVVITNLTIAAFLQTSISESICGDDSFFVGGAFQTVGGIYYDTLTASGGCDSIIETELTVLSAVITNLDFDICAGDSVFAGGAFQTTTNTYYDTLVGASGCDSIVITDLTVLSNAQTNLPVTICTGDSTFVGGAFQTTPGVYYDTLAAASGCDSVVVTDLLVLGTIVTNDSVAICAGDSAFAGGAFQTTPGVYYDTLVAANGCDSVVITDLTVLPNSLTNQDVSICDGDSALAGGSFQTTTGVYYDTLASANGCDSIMVTDLTVLQHAQTNLSFDICAGDSVFAGGAFQTSVGTYYDTLPAANGCDSVVITDVTVVPFFLINFPVSICDGDSFFAAGTYQTLSDFYYDTLTASGGCDSIIETELTVLSASLTIENAQICAGDSFLAGGVFQTATGLYYDTLAGVNGCDSIIETDLLVISAVVTNDSVAICTGDSTFAGGAFQTTPGIYYDTLVAASGCDSIVATTLSYSLAGCTNPSASNYDINAVCDDGSCVFSGCTPLAATGNAGLTPPSDSLPCIERNVTYLEYVYLENLDTFTSGFGDIIVNYLTIDSITNLPNDIFWQSNPSATFLTGETGCIEFSGTTNDSIGNYTLGIWITIQYTNAFLGTQILQGEASALITQIEGITGPLNVDFEVFLTVIDSGALCRPTCTDVIDSFSLSICAGDSVFAGGSFQTTSGTYVDSLISPLGCDSVIVTELDIVQPVSTNVDVAICDGDSVFAAGAYQTTDGTYFDTLVAASGCDSIVITTLAVNPNYLTQLVFTICTGDSVFAEGAYQIASGLYYDSLASAFGCDSIVESDVTVLTEILTSFSVSICDGDSFFAGGFYQTTSDIYYDTLLAAGGCDSIIETELIVLTIATTNLTISICDNDSVFAGGSFQNTTGIYSDTLTGSNSCDSIVVTDLTVLSTALTNLIVDVCAGDSFFVGGSFQTTTGTYYDTLVAANTCDSIVVTDLIVGNAISINLSVSICDGDSAFAGGAFQTTDGIYYDTLAAANSCDSIVVTDLSVLQHAQTVRDAFICTGDSLFAGGAYQTADGTFYDTLAAANSCDSVVITNLTVLSEIFVQLLETICDGDSFFAGGSFQTTSGLYYDSLLATGGCDSIVETELFVAPVLTSNFSVSICDGDSVFAGGSFQFAAGVYSDTFISSFGCDSIIITDLTVLNAATTNVALAICDGDSAFAGGAFQTTDGIYYDTLTAANTCDSIVITDLTVLPVTQSFFDTEICDGDSVFAGGAWQTTDGIYFDTLAGNNGCDSLVITTVSFAASGCTDPSATNYDANAVCDDGTCVYGCVPLVPTGTPGLIPPSDSLPCVEIGLPYNEAVYLENFDTINSTFGPITVNFLSVDSITNLPSGITTQVNPGNTFLGGETGCVQFSGTTTDSTGDYQLGIWITVQLTNITIGTQTLSGEASALITQLEAITGPLGIDFSVFLTVINQGAPCRGTCQPTTTTNDVTICAGDSIFAGGAFQTTGGVYTDSFLNAGGCDSIIITDLAVVNSFSQNLSLTICTGDSVFLEGAFQTSSGVYFDSLISSSGCDSILVTTLVVLNAYIDSFDITICIGDSVFAGGGFQDTSGTYVDSFIASTGCDSIVVTVLDVISEYVTNQNVGRCNGSAYFVGGALQTTAGIYYDTLLSSAGCDSVIVTDLQFVAFFFIQDTVGICDGDSYFAGGALQTTSGIYLDSLIATGGCDSIVETHLTVNPNPIVNFNQLDVEYCTADAPVGLVGSPSGGTFSGAGVARNTFTPADATAGGPYTITYIYADANGCGDTTTQQTSVLQSPPATFSGLDTAYCYDAEADSLLGNPTGYFTGPGISGNTFVAYFAGPGVHQITHVVPSSSGCDAASSQFTVVYDSIVPLISNLDSTYCVNDADVTLSVTPAGGVFSGTGMNGNVFSPETAGAGTFTIQYVYVHPTTGCLGEEIVDVEVKDVPVATLDGLPENACFGGGSVFPLTGTPAGGSFSGAGMVGNNFSPDSAGLGTYIVTYFGPVSNGCSFLQKESVAVNAVPTPSIVGLNAAYCFNDTVVILEGSPTGGSFSGQGVIGNFFNPEQAGSGGPYAIEYEYTDTNGCVGFATEDVLVYALTPVSISNLSPYYQVSDAAVTLDGVPAGGTFLGDGVSGNTFDPALAGIGQHAVVYVFEDSNGCVNTTIQDVTVGFTGIGITEVTSFRMYPNPFSEAVNIEFSLATDTRVRIIIVSLEGKVVSEIFEGAVQGGEKQQHLFSAGALANGMYFYRMITEDGSIFNRKLVLNR